MSSALAKRIRHGRYVNETEQKQEEFVMIGYGCTIFRDDEKADFFDEERHLLAHPSDNSVTLDRYDARLHLHDLDLYDAIKSGRSNDDGKTKDGDVDESELEFERYRDLMAADDAEEANYGSNASSAVEVASDSSAGSRTSSPFVEVGGKGKKTGRKEQPFVTPPELELPPEISSPKTMQHHAIIAKTAAFVATKGPQMEIVIKAKQKTKDNNHFEFLEFDDALRPYYDHVLAMIKRGRYQFTEPEEESDEDDEGGDYLHPSLMISASSSSLVQLAKSPETPQQQQQEKEQRVEEKKEKVPEEPRMVDLQPIMDRLAEYVARNGDAFEDVVRTRKDPLYSFIEPKHEYYAYYRQRVAYYRSQLKQKAESKTQEHSVRHGQARSSTSSPALTTSSSTSRYERSERHGSRRYSPPSSRSSRSRRRSRSRDDSGDEDRKRRRSRDRKKPKRSRRSPSKSDEEDEAENKKRSSAIKFASFVPVPTSEGRAKEGSAEASPIPDNVVKKSLGVEDEEKEKTDEAKKKIQEERRARAKVFLRLIKDRDQTASKVVNAKKPWEDD